MNCVELHQSLAEVADSSSREQQAHLAGCRACSTLVADLNLIISTAAELREVDEPSPRVWNSIEIALRREGLIRQPQPQHRAILPSLTRRWGYAAWLVPTAAAMLVGAAFFLYQRPANHRRVADNSHPQVMSSIPSGNASDTSDEQLLQEVSARAPMMRTAYESNLRDVNAYIRDAQDSVNANPNDAEAQQALMDAYGQKSMIYEMALDRSLQ